MSDVPPYLADAFRDRYVLERELGRGGMATVYLGADLRHHRRVAIKILHPELARTVGGERFLREIEIAASLRHPHILPLFESGRVPAGPAEDEILYYVMPQIEGESLASRIAREGPLPIEEAVAFAREVADALAYAHTHGVIHRDIKPGNILLDAGHAVVTDFGIARAVAEGRRAGAAAGGSEVSTLTDAGTSVGTPQYMSPEQAAGERELDGRSDLYSLGCTLYEMLAGQPPFGGATAEVVMRQHLTAAPPPVTQLRPAVPAHVAAAVARSLAKNPADRFNPMGRFAAALQEDAARTVSVPSAPSRRRAHWALAIVAVVLALAASSWWLTRSGRSAAPTAPGSPPPGRSIGVLPFVNLSGDPANDYFSDGITEEILTTLAQTPGLQVAARTSAFRFKSRHEDVREIGRQLGVATVLEGSVQRAGDAVRITAQLVDAGTGYHLWSGKFDRDMANLFVVEDEIARTIADTLQVPLGVAGPRVAARRTDDPVAHELYLRGLALIAERGPGLASAAVYFDSVLTRDSGFAPAWAGLAQAYELGLYETGWRAEDLAAADRAARRALALDSTLASAHGVTATLHRDQWRWAQADSAYHRALTLAPGDAETLDQYAQFLMQTGQLEAARRWEERTRRLNPLAPDPLLVIGSILVLQRRYDSALTVLTDAARRLPGVSAPTLWALWANVMRRQFDEAENHAGPVAARTGSNPEVYRKLIRGVADPAERGRALALMARDIPAGRMEDPELPGIGRMNRIVWRAMLEDTAGMYREMERFAALGRGETFMFWYEAFDRYREDPRFRRMLRRFGLPYDGRPLEEPQ